MHDKTAAPNENRVSVRFDRSARQSDIETPSVNEQMIFPYYRRYRETIGVTFHAANTEGRSHVFREISRTTLNSRIF